MERNQRSAGGILEVMDNTLNPILLGLFRPEENLDEYIQHHNLAPKYKILARLWHDAHYCDNALDIALGMVNSKIDMKDIKLTLPYIKFLKLASARSHMSDFARCIADIIHEDGEKIPDEAKIHLSECNRILFRMKNIIDDLVAGEEFADILKPIQLYILCVYDVIRWQMSIGMKALNQGKD